MQCKSMSLVLPCLELPHKQASIVGKFRNTVDSLLQLDLQRKTAASILVHT